MENEDGGHIRTANTQYVTGLMLKAEVDTMMMDKRVIQGMHDADEIREIDKELAQLKKREFVLNTKKENILKRQGDYQYEDFQRGLPGL